MKHRSHHLRHPLRQLLTLLCLLVLIGTSSAQQPEPIAATQSPEDRIALYQALLDLTNPWTVMCIAAHPDDEDGTSLIVMRRKYGAHTVSLFTTFGEGGQNAIGPELYEEMGAIRARETMAASEIQGSEPHFLGLKDFGFSKSADEAFKFWDHDEALRRMVLQIRKLRPDVIITNHNSTGGHGHHQATGRLELEAFDAAADPKSFPEQLKDGVTTWQVQRLFLRVGFGNRAAEQNEGTVTIDPNERDPIRGTVFAEEALRALQKHATQGPWPKTFADMLRFRNSQDGKLALTRYRLVREAKGAAVLPKDSHNFLDGLKLPEKIAKQVEPPAIDGKPLTGFVDQSGRVLEALLDAWKNKTGSAPSTVETSSHVSSITERLKTALARASGVTLRIMPSDNALVRGTTTTFSLTLANQGEREIRIRSVTLFGPVYHKNKNLEEDVYVMKGPGILTPGKVANIPVDRQTPTSSEISLPHAEHLYDGRFVGERFTAATSLEIEGVRIELKSETHLDIAPAIEISVIKPSPLVINLAKVSPARLNLRLVNHTAKPTEVGVQLSSVIPGAPFKPCWFEFGPRESREVTCAIGDVQPLRMSKNAIMSRQRIGVTVLRDSKAREVTDYRPLDVVWMGAEVLPNLRIGYLRGFDHSLPNALDTLGVESKELSVNDVKTTDLQKYSSIIVDNRVYESQPELIAANQKLLDYANEGGTLIVFYHKSNEWNPDERRNRPQQLAPYKLILGGERITDETAPITFLGPGHPLLNVPNKMGPNDFANWIQERGLYYPREWDPEYHALLQSNDAGEAPLEGGLLVAAYGQGHYIYSSMVWYRQLRGGIPGAYRMLANMISYGHAEGKSKK